MNLDLPGELRANLRAQRGLPDDRPASWATPDSQQAFDDAVAWSAAQVAGIGWLPGDDQPEPRIRGGVISGGSCWPEGVEVHELPAMADPDRPLQPAVVRARLDLLERHVRRQGARQQRLARWIAWQSCALLLAALAVTLLALR